MPSGESWLGIITSIANPLGCHGNGSSRYPNMVLISGKSTLIARAAQMVLTCNRCSGATPAGNGIWNCWAGAAAGAVAASDSTSAGLATCGPAAVGAPPCGAGAAGATGFAGGAAAGSTGATAQHLGSVLWA